MKPWRRAVEAIGGHRIKTVLFLLGLVAFFAVVADVNLLNFSSLYWAYESYAYHFVAAAGMACIMRMGGIDLSIGYQISLVAVVAGRMLSMGLPPPLAVLAGLALGTLCGGFNGFLITGIRISPLVATLATQMLFRGVSYSFSRGMSFSFISNDAFRVITKGSILGIKPATIVALLSVCAVGVIFHFLYLGSYVRAIGENEPAAVKVGIPVRKTKVTVYMISGLFAAITAILMLSQNGVASSSTGENMSLMTILTVICGRFFTTDDDEVWGLISGVLMMICIEVGILSAGWGVYQQYLIIGVVYTACVALEGWKKMREEEA